MSKTLIVAAAKTVDNHGSLQQALDVEAKILNAGIDLHHLYIEPLSTDWHEQSKPDHFKSGCAPVEALARAKFLIEQGTEAVVISGEDNIKSDYSRYERQQRMAVYGDDYPLTQAYTDLAKAFIKKHDIDDAMFKRLSERLFDNHKQSFRHALSDDFDAAMLPDEKWYKPLTELFRGVDCANPMVDFSGTVVLVNGSLAKRLNLSQCIELSAVGLSVLAGDGPEYIDQIADYRHLKAAYQSCCDEAGLDFAQVFRQGSALLETYTCYPVVPMAFLLVSGLVDVLENAPEFLQQHLITVTGGMNLARAPWNNPALNGIVTMYQRLCEGDEEVGMVHANGGLGYRQGVALMSRV